VKEVEGEALEGEDVGAEGAGGRSKKETFCGEGGLLWGDPEERWAEGVGEDGVANLLGAGLRFAGAGTADDKFDRHWRSVAWRGVAAKNKSPCWLRTRQGCSLAPTSPERRVLFY